jgi:hypothetical protein
MPRSTKVPRKKAMITWKYWRFGNALPDDDDFGGKEDQGQYDGELAKRYREREAEDIRDARYGRSTER